MTIDAAAAGPARVQDGIATVFDDASGYYKDVRWDKNRLTRFERDLTRTVIEEELGDTRVSAALEIGCGPGTWTPLLTARAASVTALDLSEGMLAQARANVTAPNVRFVQGDAAGFSSEDRFDCVMSVRVLEYVPEWHEVVLRLGSLLRPGGRALIITKTPISVWRGTGRERWFGPHTLARTLTGRRLNDDFWQRHIPVHAMRDAFAEAGMGDLRVRPVIFGLPIYMRGTKQYPIVPEIAEPPALRASEAAWRWVSGKGPAVRRASLVLAESYAVSGIRR